MGLFVNFSDFPTLTAGPIVGPYQLALTDYLVGYQQNPDPAAGNQEMKTTIADLATFLESPSSSIWFANLQNNSAAWNSNYLTTNALSAGWQGSVAYSGLSANFARIDIDNTFNCNNRFNGNVTINGNLTALGDATFRNTIFTTTSALSVMNTGPGPALYVFQATGPDFNTVAEFVGGVFPFEDDAEVPILHIRNSEAWPVVGDPPGYLSGADSLGKIGINNRDPILELTVNGAISSNQYIVVSGWGPLFVGGATSDQWNEVYTNVNQISTYYILDGGNPQGSDSRYASLSIGPRRQFNLSFITNSAVRVVITSAGRMGLNTWPDDLVYPYTIKDSVSAVIALNTSAAVSAMAGITYQINRANRYSTTIDNQGTFFVTRHAMDGTVNGTVVTLLSTGNSIFNSPTAIVNSNDFRVNSNDVIFLSSNRIVLLGPISGNNITTSFNSGSATGNRSFAVNSGRAYGVASFAKGTGSIASGINSHAQGNNTLASGNESHAEGITTTASGSASHAEGRSTTASGNESHAEGLTTTASGSASHAEGNNTNANGNNSHSEGFFTRARGNTSHAAGSYAESAHDRTWIWKGSSLTNTISTTRTDQFLVSAAGGVYIPGNVGIGTDNNDNSLTVTGTISTGFHNTSIHWNSVYSTTNTNSAGWESTEAKVVASSASWDSVYSNSNALTAGWEATRTKSYASSASWDSVYSTVNTFSASWDSVYSNSNALTAGWEATRTKMYASSASWDSVYSTTNTNSAEWETAYAVVQTLTGNFIYPDTNLLLINNSNKNLYNKKFVSLRHSDTATVVIDCNVGYGFSCKLFNNSTHYIFLSSYVPFTLNSKDAYLNEQYGVATIESDGMYVYADGDLEITFGPAYPDAILSEDDSFIIISGQGTGDPSGVEYIVGIGGGTLPDPDELLLY